MNTPEFTLFSIIKIIIFFSIRWRFSFSFLYLFFVEQKILNKKKTRSNLFVRSLHVTLNVKLQLKHRTQTLKREREMNCSAKHLLFRFVLVLGTVRSCKMVLVWVIETSGENVFIEVNEWNELSHTLRSHRFTCCDERLLGVDHRARSRTQNGCRAQWLSCVYDFRLFISVFGNRFDGDTDDTRKQNRNGWINYIFLVLCNRLSRLAHSSLICDDCCTV